MNLDSHVVCGPSSGFASGDEKEGLKHEDVSLGEACEDLSTRVRDKPYGISATVTDSAGVQRSRMCCSYPAVGPQGTDALRWATQAKAYPTEEEEEFYNFSQPTRL